MSLYDVSLSVISAKCRDENEYRYVVRRPGDPTAVGVSNTFQTHRRDKPALITSNYN